MNKNTPKMLSEFDIVNQMLYYTKGFTFIDALIPLTWGFWNILASLLSIFISTKFLYYVWFIMIICGIGLGILVVSSPKSALVGLKVDLIKAFKGGIATL